MGEILAQQIERRLGTQVDRKLNLGGTLLADQAVKSGSIDLYPEYTGTALTAVLKLPVSNDRKAVFARVQEGYRPFKLVWMDSLGFDNTFAMVVRTDEARRSSLRTISDAVRRQQPWRIGVGYEFVQRPDGLQGLIKTYGLRLNGEPISMDLGLLYPALQAGRIEMGAASATDGFLANPEFTVLADDLGYFPPYECGVIVRQDTLDAYPQLRAALQELTGRISAVDMRRLNAAVDREHRNVRDVASEFLQQVQK